MNPLERFVDAELHAPVGPEIAAAARAIALRLGGDAVLFYGSVLRTGDLDGVLDFYVLHDRAPERGPIRRYLWPDVSYHEVDVAGRTVRAKVASMTLADFARAARGQALDATIWARFVQRAALVWLREPTRRPAIVGAVAAAAVTAARFAAFHGPVEGDALAFWRALFRATYATELRVEAPGREEHIVAPDADRYRALLPLAWAAGGIDHDGDGGTFAPRLPPATRRMLATAWRRHRRAGKPLNVANVDFPIMLLRSRNLAYKLRKYSEISEVKEK